MLAEAAQHGVASSSIQRLNGRKSSRRDEEVEVRRGCWAWVTCRQEERLLGPGGRGLLSSPGGGSGDPEAAAAAVIQEAATRSLLPGSSSFVL